MAKPGINYIFCCFYCSVTILNEFMRLGSTVSYLQIQAAKPLNVLGVAHKKEFSKAFTTRPWQMRDGSKIPKKYFYFLSHWPPKNFGDLSYKAPPRNKEKRKLFCVFLIRASLSSFCLTRDCFVYVFVLGLRAKNSQYWMARSSVELGDI